MSFSLVLPHGWKTDPLYSGLDAIIMPDGSNLLDSKRPLSVVGTKTATTRHGSGRGYGTTSGVGSSDTILTSYAKNSDYLTVVVPLISNGAGGGTFGRVFQKGDGSAYECLLFQSNASSLEFMHVGPGAVKQTGAVSIPASGTPFVFAGVTKYAAGAGNNETSNGQQVSLYIDGVLGTRVTVSVDNLSLVSASAKEYRLGNRSDSIRNFDGVIGPILFFNRELTAVEVARVSSNFQSNVRPIQRRIWVPSAGGDYNVTGIIGTADASGFTANVDRQAAISGTLGTATADGFTAGINRQTAISGTLGTATASGFTATIDRQYQVAGTIGTATASGFDATVELAGSYEVTGILGTATASGYTANVDRQLSITTDLGTAVALGFVATVSNGTIVPAKLYIDLLTGNVLLLKEL